MKNLLRFFVLFALLQITPLFSQTFMDAVSATKGDTLVIKTQIEMGGDANALYTVIHGDSDNVPAGRVYELQAGGVYPNLNAPSSYPDRTTILVGSDATPLVNNSNAANTPPLIVGYVGTSGTTNGSLGGSGDWLVKNCALAPTADDGSEGWAFHGSGAADQRIEYDNCLFEHTRWIEVAAFNANVSFFLRDCYFVNLNGQPCRRNGGVYDGFANLDTFLVENSTHIMAQGSMYKWRNYPATRIIVNHNTFVNSSGLTFMDLGSQTNASYTNNLFVNCNVQPAPGVASIDDGEHDIDLQPMGLVNVYPDTALHGAARHFLVEGNDLYWSPALSNVTDTVNTLAVIGISTWKSQMILMNTRSQGMFDDNTTYPFLTEGKQYAVDPGFTDPKDLLGAQVWALKAFSVGTVDTSSTDVLADWRLVNTGAANYIYFDWPIPVDLSYTNATLKTGATGGYPVGDLNWFPDQKKTWLAQRAAEYTAIQTALDNGTTTISTGVQQVSNVPGEYRLDQNYPNPFNPSTKISFSLPHSANVSLKVFDMLGREIATLVNGYTNAGSHEVTFNASNLSSGIYFYKLVSGNFTEIKKMMLVK